MYRIETEALGEKVHKALRMMLINGELRPGQKLIQDDLAANLGVSRTPLLSAFSKLEQEKLVFTVPRRGAYVRQYTDKELLDLCNIRMRLESLGAREAALAGAEDLSSLELILKNFDKAVKKRNEALIKQLDYGFHMEILRISGNKFLYDMLFSHIIIVLNIGGFLMNYPETSMTEHHEILESIRAGNPEKAESLMFNHTSRPVQYLNLRKSGEQP
jgi:DNA-binding GntR family transcriptional regulator